MSTLTNEERFFLRSQYISIDDLLDAFGMKTSEAKNKLEETGQHFYFGAGRPCIEGGHRLRSKAGHCIQCDTSRIAYTLRSSSTAIVYIAGSSSTKLIKVGSSTMPNVRILHLSQLSYGGASDWELLASVQTEKAGRVEYATHARLAEFSHSATYEKTGTTHEADELFRCPYRSAKDALAASLQGPKPIKVHGNEQRIITVYG